MRGLDRRTNPTTVLRRRAGTLALAALALAAAEVSLAQAPTGWLILSGPSGPNASCDLTRAYDINTGAAFVHDVCVDRIAASILPAATVRDIVAALLARTPPAWMPGERIVTHAWRWVASDDLSLIGDLPWPDPTAPEATDRALALVRAADAVIVGACAPPLPPPSLVLVATLPRMVNPVSADASQELIVRYRTARERWARLPACGGPAREIQAVR